MYGWRGGAEGMTRAGGCGLLVLSLVVFGKALGAELLHTGSTSVVLDGFLHVRYEHAEDETGKAEPNSEDGVFTAEESEAGLSVEHRFMDELSGRSYFGWGWESTDSGGLELESKDIFVEFITRYGRIRAGKFNSVLEEFAGKYDMSWEFGDEAKLGSDWAGTDRLEGAMAYIGELGNVTVMVSAEAAAPADGIVGDYANYATDAIDVKHSYAAGLDWAAPLGLELALSWTDTTLEGIGSEAGPGYEGHATALTVDAAYSIGSLCLGCMYGDYRFEEGLARNSDQTVTGLGLGARYGFGKAGIYGVFDRLEENEGNRKETTAITFGADYVLDPALVFFVEFVDEDVSSDDAGNDDENYENRIATVGTRIRF